ncbi:unnamed protein product [Arctogadus glacialis]
MQSEDEPTLTDGSGKPPTKSCMCGNKMSGADILFWTAVQSRLLPVVNDREGLQGDGHDSVHPTPRSSAGLQHPEESAPPNPQGRPGPEQADGAQWRVGEETNRAQGGARRPCGPFGYSGSHE